MFSLVWKTSMKGKYVKTMKNAWGPPMVLNTMTNKQVGPIYGFYNLELIFCW